jgi:hypothetical protein
MANVVPMKNGVFWDVTPCDSCKNRRFGGTTRRNIPEDTILHSNRRENLKSYNIVPSSPILVTLIGSSDTSVLTRATRHHIPEDGILHSHRLGNLESYITLTGWTPL